MGIRQVERLYRNIINIDYSGKTLEKIDTAVRTEIFQKIMDDVERLLKKLKNCREDSAQYSEIDCEIRNLLLKEIQVIIDDYVISKKNGTLERWKDMYGDINRYINNFHKFRETSSSNKLETILNRYGLYGQDDLL
jgi:hypothetical protein